MKPRPLSFAGSHAVATALLLAACAGQAPAPAPALVPPQSDTFLFELNASGDQVYECARTEHATPGWVYRYPQAVLRNAEGFALATHGKGPSWTADDGSMVIAKVVAEQPSPSKKELPWLLLRVTDVADGGEMAPVRSIQRVDTQGGQPPLQSCDETLLGQLIAVPYRARYRFFGVPPVAPEAADAAVQ